MTEHCFTELGYFDQRDCKAIKEHLQGQSYMCFDIGWANCAGNCTLIVSTELEKTSEDDLKEHFLWCALSEIFQLDRKLKQGGIQE